LCEGGHFTRPTAGLLPSGFAWRQQQQNADGAKHSAWHAGQLAKDHPMHLRFRLGLILVLGGCWLQAADQPAAPAAAPAGPATFNLRDFGATGDGRTKDTAGLQKALDACTAAGGGTVVVPPGAYLTGSIVLGGNTTLKLERGASLVGSPDIADYPLEPSVRWEGEFRPGHRALISAGKVDHIAIEGPGAIFGPPINLSVLRNPRGPTLIELTDANHVRLENFATQYERLWSIHLLFCRDVTARNLVIRSIESNGDGIDVDSCQDVLIEHCDINTGDDAIALKSGRGLAAQRLGRPTEHIVIRDCTLVSSIFAGMALGSEMSGGIRNVRLEHCVIGGRQNGISIKSRDGRGGFFEDISGEDLTLINAGTFLDINLLRKGIQASDPVPGPVDQWARLSNVRFHDIKVSGVGVLVSAANIPAERPIDGLSLTDITGTCGRGIMLANATNVELAAIHVTGFSGPLVTADHVTGTGLDDPAAAR
jgi:polygalacturonase